MLRFLKVFRENKKSIRAYKALLEKNADKIMEWTPQQQRLLIDHPTLRTYFQQLLKAGFPLHSMQGWDFKRSLLVGMDFTNCDLSAADMRSSVLVNAKFDKANVSGVDFRKTDLTGASFIGAHCYKTNFKLARMAETNFTAANIRGVIKDSDVKLYKQRVKRKKEKTMRVISPDELLYEGGLYVWTKERVARAWAESYQQYGKWLMSCAQKPEAKHELWLTCGIPSSGKSIWVYDSDSTLDANDTNDNILIFDATLISRIARSALLNIAKAVPGLKVKAVVFETPLSLCLSRNAGRSKDRQVPTNTLYDMNKRFEAPQTREGFDEVIVVEQEKSE